MRPAPAIKPSGIHGVDGRPGLVPPGAVCCLDRLENLAEPLHPAELPGTEGMVPVRLREFVAGRTAARRAIGLLTGEQPAIPRRQDRSPLWPEGLCGSLSHSRRYAIAVVAPCACHHAIGVDIEEDARLTEDLWSSVMTENDLSRLRRLPAPDATRLATLLFSAKEAYYKCLPRHLHQPGKLPEPTRIDIAIDFETATLTGFSAALEFPSLPGRFARFDHHWITLFHLTDGPGIATAPTSHGQAECVDINGCEN